MDGDLDHDDKARREFNREATESLQRHRDNLTHSQKVTSDAAQDLAQRTKYRQNREDIEGSE